MNRRVDSETDRAFHVVLALKALDGVLELVGGVLLFFVTPTSIQHLVRWATSHELAQDPGDFLATHLLRSADHITASVALFGAVYLSVHGAAKILLVWEVLRDRLWAYTWLIGLTAAFLVYELFLMTNRPSIVLFVASLVDAAVIVLTWRERQARRPRYVRELP